MASSTLEEKILLQKAVESADFKTIRQELIRNPESCKLRDKCGRSMLHFAFEISKKRISLGSHETCFYETIIIKVLKMLLDSGVDIDARGDDGRTALWLAVEFEMELVVQFLLLQGSDVEVTDIHGDNLALLMVRILQSFSSYIIPEFCYDSLNKGIDVDAMNKSGQTAFRLAIEQESVNIAKLLALQSSEINYVNSTGKNLAHIMIDQEDFDVEHLLILFKKGLRLDVFDNSGRTPMHFAASKTFVPKSMYFMVNEMQDINHRDNYGNTLLHYAARFPSSVDFFTMLVRKGASIHQKGRYDLYPVQIAVLYQNLPLLRMLSDCQVQFDVRTSTGATLLHLYAGSMECQTSVAEAVEVIDIILEKGCDIEARLYINGMTPLHVAAEHDTSTIITALLFRGAKVDCKDGLNATPLHVASSTGSLGTLSELIQAGADLSIRNGIGHFPLRIAMSADNVPVVRCLLDNGADINDIAQLNSQIEFLKMVKRDKKCWHVLESHCVMLKVVKSYIADSLSSLISWDSELIQIQIEKCLRHTEIMKMHEVAENVSLLDVLQLAPDRRYKYCNELYMVLKFVELRRLIPRYENFISSSIKEIVERRKMYESAVQALHRLTKVRLPDICTNLIMSYLSNTEMKTIVAVTRSQLRQMR